MKNHVLVSVVVVAVAIFLGVTITVHKVNDPVMKRLISQQNEILLAQRGLQRQLAGGAPQPQVDLSAPAAGGQDTAAFLRKQQELEQKVSLLEKRVESLLTVMRNMQGQGAPGGGPGAGAMAGGAGAMGQQPPTEEYTKVHKIDIGKSPVKGPKNAPVTIVEFVDFQCPFSSRFHPVINEVLAAYPDKVNYVMKNFPLSFHPQARPAAKAAFAAGEQGKYFEMIELLFQNKTELTDDKFKELAKNIGLDVKKFMDDYKKKDAEWDARINADMDLGQQVEVRGTPTYYINGRKTMARDLNTYKKEIDEILKK